MAGAVQRRYSPLIRDAYRKYGVLPRHLAGLIDIESGWDRYATSPAGARYLTQFMPGTAASYGVYGKGKGAVRSQIMGAAHYLHDLGYKRGNPAAVRLALASYNAGPGNPGAAGSYPENVLAASQKYRGIGRGAGSPTRRSGGGAVSVTQPSVSRGQVEPGGAGVSSLLAELLKRPARGAIQSAGVAPPSFSAHAAMPAGFRRLPSSSVAGPDTRLSDLLQAVEGLQGAAPPGSTVTPGSVSGGAQNGGGRRSGGSGGLEARADGWYGTKTLAQAGKDIAAEMGIPISSEKRSTKNTATGGISDHWLGNKRAWADDYDSPGIDSATGHKLARRIARAYGVKYVPNSYASGGTIKVGKRTYRVQILYGSGVGHGDHVHVGLERIL